jgi:hypothetical protein
MVCLAVVALLTGCKDKAQQQKIAALDARIVALETNVAGLRNDLNQLSSSTMKLGLSCAVVEQDNVSNTIEISKLTALLGTIEDTEQTMIETMRMLTNRIPKGYAASRSVVQPAQNMREGVPIDVYNAIAAHAAEMYPNNYDMQVSKIKWEVEAYKKLHPQ